MRKLFGIILLIVLICAVIGYFAATYWANQELKRIAFEQTKNIPDDKNKAIALSTWIRGNLKPESAEKSSEMVFLTKQGDCVGLTNVFVLMSNSIGLPARIVGTSGERHYWAEVFINNEWFNLDPFNDVNGNSFGNVDFYDTWDAPFGKRFSFVSWTDGAGNQHELTKKYTTTGRLIVKVQKDAQPAIARIIVKSHHLTELDSNHYKNPDTSLIEVTNESGIFEKDLGPNNYTIVAEQDILPFSLLVSKSEKETNLAAGQTKEILFDSGFQIGFGELALINGILLATVALFAYIAIQLFKIIRSRFWPK